MAIETNVVESKGYESILYDVKDRIATITINRPEQLNTWNDMVAIEVYEAMQRAGADKGVRVIIFTGAGKAFCAGGDINSFGGDPHQLMTKLPRLRHAPACGLADPLFLLPGHPETGDRHAQRRHGRYRPDSCAVL